MRVMNFQNDTPLRRGLVLAVLMLTGCVASIHTPYDPGAENPAETASLDLHPVAAMFDYPRDGIVVDNHDLPFDKHDYQLKRIQLPAPQDNGQAGNVIRMLYYRHNSPQRKPLVIVVPIYGSYTYPSEKITNGLVKMDFPVNVALMEYAEHLLDMETLAAAQTELAVVAGLDNLEQRLAAGVMDVRRVIDWAEQQEDIDGERIGLATFSMSALVGSLLAQHEPRLAAGVIVMGAANFHDVMAVCGGRAGQAREAIMQRLGWSEQQYRQQLLDSMGSINPARFSDLADPSKLLLIDAQHDDCMPQHSRDALWEALGRPERISYQYGHKQSFLAMSPLGFNVMRRRIYEFFATKLELNELPDADLVAAEHD
jgi:hypothetical protein